MGADHPSPQVSRGDFTLVQRRDDIDHADADAHQESPDEKQCYVHRRGLDDARDDAQHRCYLYCHLTSKGIPHLSHRDAAQEATSSEYSIGSTCDARAFRSVGTIQVDSKVLEERIKPKHGSNDGRILTIGQRAKGD